MNLDLYLFNLLNQYAGRWEFLDNLVIFFANNFQYVIVLFFLVFFLKILRIGFKECLRIGIPFVAAAFLSRIVITEIIRHFFPRLRPFVENTVNLILDKSGGEPSMPSGHAALFFSLATIIYFYNKKFGIFLFISAFLISISRVFAGIHWPSDILVGAIVGVLSSLFVYKASQKYFKLKTPL